MRNEPRFADSFTLKAVLLFLAMSVFSWGLGAKLSLYGPPPSSSQASAAKMSADKGSIRTEAVILRLGQVNPSRSMAGASPFVVHPSVWISSLSHRQVELKLHAPSRTRFNGPTHRRPPPPVLC